MTFNRDYWRHCIQVLKTPAILYGGLYDACAAWWMTRRWFSIAVCFSLICTSIFALVFAFISRLQNRDVLSLPFAIRMENELPLKFLMEHNMQRHLQAIRCDNQLQDHLDESRFLPDPNWSHIDWDKASFLAQCASRLAPLDQRLTIRIALIHDELGREPEATNLMSKMASDQTSGFLPAHAWRVNKLAQQAMHWTDAQKAQYQFHLALAREWGGVNTLFLHTMACMLEKQGEREKAIELMRSASETDLLEMVDAIHFFERQGLHEDRLQTAKQLVRFVQEKQNRGIVTADEEFQMALSLEILSQNQEALELFRKLAKHLESGHALARATLLNRLIALQRQQWREAKGKAEASLAWLTEMAELAPLEPQVGELVAEATVIYKQIPELPREVLKNQLISNLATAQTLALIGKAYNARGNFDQAILRCNEALEKDKQSVEAIEQLTIAFLAKSEWEKAAALSLRGMDLGGRSATFLALHGESLVGIGDQEKAGQIWEECLQVDPKRVEVRRKLAELYKASGQGGLAAMHEAKIAEDNPTPMAQ